MAPLPAEQRQELESLVATLTQSQAVISKTVDNLAAQMQWLERHNQLAAMKAAAETETRDARAILDSETVRSHKDISRQWHETAEPRAAIAEKSKLQARQRELSYRRKNLTARFSRYLFSVSAFQTETAKKQSALDAIESDLEARSPKAILLAEHSRIDASLQAISMSDKNIRVSEAALKKAQAAHGEAVRMLATGNEHLTKAEVAEKKAAEEYTSLENAVSVMNPLGLADEISRLSDERKTLVESLKSIDARSTLDAQAKALSETINQERSEESAIESMLSEASSKSAEANAMLALKKEIYEAVELTTREIVNELRHHLKAGCECPVCRQTVGTPVPVDSVADNARLSEARLRYEQAQGELASAESQRTALQTRLELNRKSIAAHLSDLAEIGTRLDDARKQCAVVLEKISLHPDAPELTETITRRINVLDSDIAAVKETMRKVESLQCKVREAKLHAARCAEALAEARTAVSKSETIKASLDAEINTRIQDTARNRAVRDSNVQEILSLPGIEVWNFRPDTDADSFSAAYHKELDDYSVATKRRDQLLSDIKSRKERMNSISRIEQQIHTLDPTLSACTPEESPLSDPLDECTVLLSEIRTMTDAEATVASAISETETAIMTFLAAHPDTDIDSLKQLQLITSEQIRIFKQEITEAERRVTQAVSRMESFSEQLDLHLKSRPEIEPDATPDTIGQRLAAAKSELNNTTENLSRTKARISLDDETLQSAGQLAHQTDEAYAEYAHWDELNQLLGSADGSKFRRIAQSYVLASLLEASNAYLRRLTRRYTLRGVPGTFNIEVVDAWQGGVARSANTSSGGESFMVSLALALALSDISDNLIVDTLFIDEGFGTLSAEPLQNAISLLQSLHKHSGRRVGIISHVEELRSRIPVQISVDANPDSGASTITVTR